MHVRASVCVCACLRMQVFMNVCGCVCMCVFGASTLLATARTQKKGTSPCVV